MPGRKSYHKIIIAAGTFLVLVSLISCSTKKNTFTRRLYHNITSRYNVYFNGIESLNEGSIELLKDVKENYTKVLPVFNFGTKQEAQQLNPQMDRAIQKASIAIQKHSMPFEGAEKVKWIDDSYMMIGKAYFYKQEYFSARRTFNFIIQEYGYNEIKYDAMIWLALTYNQTAEFEKTEPLLNLITADIEKGLVPYDVIKTLPQVYADLYVRKENWDQSVEFLTEAIFYNPKRDLKTRMMFILGQIYHKGGDYYRASEWYTKVIKRSPPYDMAFQAKINLAKSYDTNTGDKKQVTKILTRMLKDDKNKDYKDQVYFALADVALRDGDTAMAIEYLRSSVSSSVNNNYQLVTSALTVADLYFEIPSYENAQAYYDTAMTSLPKDYPDFENIERRTKVLNDLVENLIVIQHEDSLQRLVNMSENERNQVIDKFIAAYMEEQAQIAEQQKLEQQLTVQEQAVSFSGGPGSPALPVGGKWYFYNVQTKDIGYAEFVKKWGRRKLEDLWRISDKQAIAYTEAFEEESDTTKSDSLMAAENNPMARQYYLKDLPFTEDQLAASNNNILEAYYNAGLIYKDGLNDNDKARDAFLSLDGQFPENDHKLIIYYYLYKIYLEAGLTADADYYKNLVITQYPDSDYAKVLADPDYYAKIAEELNKVNILYSDTYKDYKAGLYFQVIAKSDLAFSLYGDTMELAPRFAYLKAISIGKIDVLDSLVSQLTMVIRKYPSSEVKPLAQNLLATIVKENPEIKVESVNLPGDTTNTGAAVEKESPYKVNPVGQHMFMIVADSKEMRLNPFKVKLSDYNQKYYSIEGLTINSLVLDNEHYLITIGNFNNSTKAKDYFDAITLSEYVYADLKPGTFYNFVISTENYPIFFKEKDIGGYTKFFEKNYIK
ncbi:MAG: tetratricopeptide repeat protein [Bacteroidales bacterium]|nr:tetratricopeptide repeat protein [Bacteroidales bacterium]